MAGRRTITIQSSSTLNHFWFSLCYAGFLHHLQVTRSRMSDSESMSIEDSWSNCCVTPLTDSQFRQQRTLASTKVKSTSTNVINESSSIGTDVNPRERPRGMMTSTVSLMNFTTATPATQLTSKTVQSPPSSAPSRSDSAAQLIFDDDFSQIPSHAISLTNISHPPPTTDATSTGRTASRARPSPPGTLSGASGLGGQQQQALPPLPPPPPSSLHPAHRRSASQTILQRIISCLFPAPPPLIQQCICSIVSLPTITYLRPILKLL